MNNTSTAPTYKEIADKPMLITVTKGDDDSYTGVAGVDATELVASAADIKNADAGDENVTLHFDTAGKVDLIILWK